MKPLIKKICAIFHFSLDKLDAFFYIENSFNLSTDFLIKGKHSSSYGGTILRREDTLGGYIAGMAGKVYCSRSSKRK